MVLYQLSYDPIQWSRNLRANRLFVKVFSPRFRRKFARKDFVRNPAASGNLRRKAL